MPPFNRKREDDPRKDRNKNVKKVAKRDPIYVEGRAPRPMYVDYKDLDLLSKLIGGVAVALLQAYAFLGIAYFWEIEPPLIGYLTIAPALVLAGLMLGSLSLFISSVIRQLENFAGVMNFVIFPMFFASSALYPLWRIREASPVLLAGLRRLEYRGYDSAGLATLDVVVQ